MSGALPPALRRPALSRLGLALMPAPRVLGLVPGPLRTRFEVGGRPVLFLHNPKAAGTSLKARLGCEGRTLHIFAHAALRRAAWRQAVVVVAVREPFARFLSGWRFHTGPRYGGALARTHGAALRGLAPEDYLDFIAQYPEYLGPQVAWVTYPDPEKPRADVVLRLEEAADWPARLAAAGIDAGPEPFERRNAGSGEDGALEPGRLAALRRRVEAVYAKDYAVLGYPRSA